MKVWKGPYKVTNTTENTIEIVNIRNGGNKRHVNGQSKTCMDMRRRNSTWQKEEYDPLLIDTESEEENKKEWEINEDPVLKEERMKTKRKRIVKEDEE